MSQNARAKIVYVVLYPGVQILDVSGPVGVLSSANEKAQRQLYDIRYVSNVVGGVVMSSAGLPLVTEPLPRRINAIHTLIVPGGDETAVLDALADDLLLAWIEKAAHRAQRISSICTGAFLLGALGLLAGKKATTHWDAVDSLQQLTPKADVQQDVLYVRDTKLWTSAGVMSGVDMALAMLRVDAGIELAIKVARGLVVYLIREGGQSQFSGPMNLQSKASQGDLLALITWLENQLEKPVSVEQMADFMAMSVRTLHRRCQQSLALTPGQLLAELRLERARNLLHQQTSVIKIIANECGYGSAEAFSKAFTLRYGVSPARYRRGFME